MGVYTPRQSDSMTAASPEACDGDLSTGRGLVRGNPHMWIISVLFIIPTCPSCQRDTLCVARILQTSLAVQARSSDPAPLLAPVDNLLLPVSPLCVHLFVVGSVIVSPGLLVNTKHVTKELCREARAGHEEGFVCVQRNIFKASSQVSQGFVLSRGDRDWLLLDSEDLQDLLG